MITVPESGFSNPHIICKSVDFPEPEAPTKAKLSPFLTDKENSCKTLKAELFCSKAFEISLISIIILLILQHLYRINLRGKLRRIDCEYQTR